MTGTPLLSVVSINLDIGNACHFGRVWRFLANACCRIGVARPFRARGLRCEFFSECRHAGHSLKITRHAFHQRRGGRCAYQYALPGAGIRHMNTKPAEWHLDRAMQKIAFVVRATSSRQSLDRIGAFRKNHKSFISSSECVISYPPRENQSENRLLTKERLVSS